MPATVPHQTGTPTVGLTVVRPPVDQNRIRFLFNCYFNACVVSNSVKGVMCLSVWVYFLSTSGNCDSRMMCVMSLARSSTENVLCSFHFRSFYCCFFPEVHRETSV